MDFLPKRILAGGETVSWLVTRLAEIQMIQEEG